MDSLIKEINNIRKTPIETEVNQRLKEFEAFKRKDDQEWFYDLCVCILAANSKQKTAEAIEKALQEKLLTISEKDLAKFILNNKHRFHNNKARYIVEARKHHPIKEKLKNKQELESRDWLIKNVKGIGIKEASHFLRNTGSKNLAILDRHILDKMSEYKIINKPKTLTLKYYLEIEEKFNNLAKELNISSAKLDLLMWYTKTGEVAK